MSYWSGDLMRGTAENPLNAHIDFGGLEVRLKGGASTLFSYKTPQTVIQNLNIIDTNKSTDTKLAPVVNYATTGPCGYAGHTDTANYVYTEQEMKDWFASYSNSANPTKSKCLKVMIPFVTTITTQLSETDYLIAGKHYDFGGATLIHSMKYLLPEPNGNVVIANAIVRATGSKLVAGLTPKVQSYTATIENCTVIFYGSITVSGSYSGGITGQLNPGSKIMNSKFIVDNSCSITVSSTFFGGMSGYAHGSITNCRTEIPSSASVTINGTNFGGLVGFGSQAVKIADSSALINIADATSAAKYVGGLIGMIGNGGQSESSYVRDSYTEGYEILGTRCLGGIIGKSTRGTTFTNVRSYITYVRGLFSRLPNITVQDDSPHFGGFVGQVEAAAEQNYIDCISLTVPYSNNTTYKTDAQYNFMGGFAGAIKTTASWVYFERCKVYSTNTYYSGSNDANLIGGFAGEVNGAAYSTSYPYANCRVSITNVKIYMKAFYHYSGGVHAGRLLGVGHLLPNVPQDSTTTVYATPNIANDGYYTSHYGFILTNSWPSSQPFGSAGVNPTVNYLNGSSVTPVSSPVSGKQIKLKFAGLSDYYLDNIYISMNDFATDINIGGYTQIMYNGTLLSDFSAKSIVGTVPKSHSRGDSNILAQDEFYFYYKSPSTTDKDVTVKVQLKHKTTGAKRTFMLFNSSQWVEI